MTVLIYSPSGDGHHIEYLHHIYMKCREISDTSFVFVAPASFRVNMKTMEWPEADNVSFDFDEVPDVTGYGKLRRSVILSRTIRKKLRQHSADCVFFDSLMFLMPCAPMILPRRAKVSGIIYKIYLYEKQSLKNRIKNGILYSILTKSRNIDRIFILNDSGSANRLNERYSTARFCYLPDPVSVFPVELVADRETLQLTGKKVYIHFGALSARKGTLSILESLSFVPEEKLKEYAFIFAGKVASDIKDSFYELVERWKDKVKIIVKDEFCPFDYLFSICSLCDAMLLPYKETSLSSGVIGYAAAFRKPVIAPSKGLLGALVDSYSLGLTCDCSSPEIMATAYEKVRQIEVSDKYLADHTIELFQDTIASLYR